MRAVVALAMHTGISVDSWLASGDREIATALELFAEEIEASKPKSGRGSQ
jgi:hypothetical protein